MAVVVPLADARLLSLPGRVSREIIGASTGARSVAVRHVTIEPEGPGGPGRGKHVHDGFEEVMIIVSGEGVTECDSGRLPVKPGDTILMPAGERHATRNTGSEPLVMLCFFPIVDVAAGTREFPPESQSGQT